MKLYRFGGVLGAITLAVVSCNCRFAFLRESADVNAFPSPTTSSSPLNQNNNKTDETRYSLDLEKPEVEQPIQLADADVAKAKFVQVEVTKVTNPNNRPARFQVHFQPREGEKILLGSFSLFPANNPGRFIVPTQGKVKGEGKLILTLVKSDRTQAGDVVQAEVKPMRFVADVEH
jgi:hypothetical protein